MENSRKEKVIKILKRVGIGISLAFNFLFVLALVIGSSVNKKQSNNIQVACAESEVIEFKQENKKLVSYDDEEYTITLSADELNNYTWDNLSSLVKTENVFTTTSMTYNSINYHYNHYDLMDNLNYKYTVSGNNGYIIGLRFSDDNMFNYSQLDNEYSSFEYDLVWNLNVNIYSSIKQAIELDIQANSQDINNGIFETLTESTVGFIGTLGNGLVAMTSIFYDSTNSQLTTIGLLSVIVVAVSLCYFLFRLIIGLIRMRG